MKHSIPQFLDLCKLTWALTIPNICDDAFHSLILTSMVQCINYLY